MPLGKIGPQPRRGVLQPNSDPRIAGTMLPPATISTIKPSTNTLAIGTGALAANTNANGAGASLAIGQNTIATTTQSNVIAIGNAVTATGGSTYSTIAIGSGASTLQGGLSIGTGLAGFNLVIGVGTGIINTTAGSAATVISNASTLTTGSGYGVTIVGAANIGTNTNNNAYINIFGTNASTFTQPPAGVHGATIIGPYSAIDNSGSLTFSAGSFSANNTATIQFLLGRMTTTSATPLEIGLPGSQTECQTSTAPTGRIILNNNSTYIFDCDIVARKSTAGTDYGAWNVKFCINREANAAATALVGAVVTTVIGVTAGAATWAVAVTADTTNGRPAINLTGVAATTIRWVMNAKVTKVTG